MRGARAVVARALEAGALGLSLCGRNGLPTPASWRRGYPAAALAGQPRPL